RSSPVPVLVVRLQGRRPYKRVIIAADLSPPSLSASQAARSIAPEAALEHVHVVEMPLSFEQALLGANTSPAAISDYRRARLARAREQLQTPFLGAAAPPVDTLRVLQGDAQRIIVQQAKRRTIELIAMGTHGRSAASALLLGSVAQNILQEATC